MLVLSINNPDFENYLGQMYLLELEIKDTTESNTSASYLDLTLSIGREVNSVLPFASVTISISILQILPSWVAASHLRPPMAFIISQLIRFPRVCSSYECFILRVVQLSNELLGQGYVKERLKSSFRKFYGRYGDVIKQYEVSLSWMLHDIF